MTKDNIYQGQLQGPFKAGQDLFDLVKEQCISAPNYIKHIGIQTATDNSMLTPHVLVQMTICGKEQTIEIGRTNCYEIGNTEITSVKFMEDKDNNTIIDYTAIINEKAEKPDSSM